MSFEPEMLDELFFPKPLTIFRESMLQQVMKNYRRVVTMAHSLVTISGSPFDIRPAQLRKNRIVARMRTQYELPPIIIPCVVRPDAWAVEAYREHLSNIFLPEFG